MIKLYQFAFSHFCEKARWALDYKSIPYTPVNLLPGLHIKPIRKLAPKTCMPVLVDGETAVQDSPAIITYLDRTHPDPLLTPRDPREAQALLAVRDQHKGRRYFGWVRNIYDNYRQPMAASIKAAA